MWRWLPKEGRKASGIWGGALGEGWVSGGRLSSGQPDAQGLARHAEDLRGPRLVAPAEPDHVLDVRVFYLAKGPGLAGGGPGGPGSAPVGREEVVGLQGAPRHRLRGLRHGQGELANISRPHMAHEPVDGPPREAFE